MKGFDITAYNTRFNELAVLCPDMVIPERKKIERYVWGLPIQTRNSVIAAQPGTFASAKRIAQQLTDSNLRSGTVTNNTDTPQEGNQKRKFNNKKY